MKIFIIGFGHMGQAIAQSLRALPVRGTQTGSKSHYDISATSRDARLKAASSALAVTPDLECTGLKDADVVILAVKPQDLAEAAKQYKSNVSANAILVSIAAGITLAKIEKLFDHKKIVRVMPNIGLSVGEGISAWKSSGLSSDDEKNVRQLLNDISENFEANDEQEIDAVTAISGSGPAYFFVFAAALLKSAKALGLADKEARALVGKTFSAAAALQKGADYEDLIKRVASKGGTTEAALRVFEKNNLSGIVEEATKAAYDRSKELNEK
ncbi:MAG: pyrroline-5-carboxylate reductase [bacterium]|nr:pyrroline-5-carboxylate reductase [bacterium]